MNVATVPDWFMLSCDSPFESDVASQQRHLADMLFMDFGGKYVLMNIILLFLLFPFITL